MALVHSSHRLAAHASVPLNALASESIVAHPSVWSVVKPYFKEAGCRPRLLSDGVPRPNTPLSILLHTRAAVGLFTPGFTPAPEGTAVVRLEPSPFLPYSLAWRRGEVSPPVKALAELIRELRGDYAAFAPPASSASELRQAAPAGR